MCEDKTLERSKEYFNKYPDDIPAGIMAQKMNAINNLKIVTNTYPYSPCASCQASDGYIEFINIDERDTPNVLFSLANASEQYRILDVFVDISLKSTTDSLFNPGTKLPMLPKFKRAYESYIKEKVSQIIAVTPTTKTVVQPFSRTTLGFLLDALTRTRRDFGPVGTTGYIKFFNVLGFYLAKNSKH
jgi:hypothetical protein